jgi:hypothetical protein
MTEEAGARDDGSLRYYLGNRLGRYLPKVGRYLGVVQ